MPVPKSTLWQLTDHRFGGKLAERLAAKRAAGVSWDQIAAEMYAEQGVRISGETLRQWFAQLDTAEAVA